MKEIMCPCCGQYIDVSEVRVDAIDEYSNKLWQSIEKCTVNCKLDFNLEDLHNLEIIIKGLAEELKGGAMEDDGK